MLLLNYKDNLYYIDHHQSHAIYAYNNSGFDVSDIIAIDGIGYNFRCIFIDKDCNIKDLSNVGSINMLGFEIFLILTVLKLL